MVKKNTIDEYYFMKNHQDNITSEVLNCYHCGDLCPNSDVQIGEKLFCCNGCKTVYQLLNENKLYNYYNLKETPGIKIETTEFGNKSPLSDPRLYRGIARDVIQEKYLEGQERRITQRVMEYVRFEDGVFTSYYGWSPYVPNVTKTFLKNFL